MTKNANTDLPAFAPLRSVGLDRQPGCLFVGDPLSLHRARQILAGSLTLDHCQIYDLAHVLHDGPHPAMVLSFAITPLFDCLDLAQMLSLNRFQGRLRLVDVTLPAPDMICREVRMACPGIDFGVLHMSELRAV